MKIYPGLILLLFIIFDLHEKKNDRMIILENVATAVATTIVMILPFMFLGAQLSDIFSFTGFHSGRGFQSESTIAIISHLLSDLGLFEYSEVLNHDTYDVVSPVTDALLPIWGIIESAIIAAVCVAVYYSTRIHHADETERSTNQITCALLVLMTFITVNTVFSTQYILWLLPFLPIVSLKLRARFGNKLIFSAILIFVLSMIRGGNILPEFFVPAFAIRALILIVTTVVLLRVVVTPAHASEASETL